MIKKYWLHVPGLFSVTDDGTVEYDPEYSPEKAKKEFDIRFCHLPTSSISGPAIEGHTIAVIRDIREKEEL